MSKVFNAQEEIALLRKALQDAWNEQGKLRKELTELKNAEALRNADLDLAVFGTSMIQVAPDGSITNVPVEDQADILTETERHL